MNEKISCISFKFKKTFIIYPILLPISCVTIHFFQKIMYEKANPEKSYIILKYNFPYLFYYFLPKIFSFIFILIIKSNTKGESSKVQKLTRTYHFMIKNENFKKIIFFIYIISLLEVIYKVGDSLLLYLQKIEKIHYLIEKRTGFIISVPLFSYLLLNKNLYKHHIFALILTLIGAFIIILTRFILKYSFIDDYLYHILILLLSFIFSFSLVLIKYIMIKFLISPYTFLFYDGIFCIINLIICVLLEYPIIKGINKIIDIKKENDNYFNNNYLKIFTLYIGEDKIFYFSFFISFIASFCYFIFNILTIFRFSPYLNVLTDFLTPFLYNVLNLIFLEKDLIL